MNKKFVLGPEYDEKLRGALLQLLKEMGGTPINRDWAIGGSQELEMLEVALAGDTVLIESETYIGLSITGDETQVVEIASRLGVNPP